MYVINYLTLLFSCVQILRNSEVSHQNSFFAVYNMETTEILAFYPVLILLMAEVVRCRQSLDRSYALCLLHFQSTYTFRVTEQNSSEELLQLVEHYWDHFRVVPQSPLYMNFISSYSNNIFAREQLRKQKAACISGKIGSYAQVDY